VELKQVDVEKIRIVGTQPRADFDSEKMEELVESIKELGLVQPVVVRENGKGYILVAGERRLRASRKAKQGKVIVMVVDADEQKSRRIQWAENEMRDDLKPLERAHALKAVIEDEEKKVGRKLSEKEKEQLTGLKANTITGIFRVLGIEDDIREVEKARRGGLTDSRILEKAASLESKTLRKKFLTKVAMGDMSGKQAREMIPALNKCDPDLADKVISGKMAPSTARCHQEAREQSMIPAGAIDYQKMEKSLMKLSDDIERQTLAVQIAVDSLPKKLDMDEMTGMAIASSVKTYILTLDKLFQRLTGKSAFEK